MISQVFYRFNLDTSEAIVGPSQASGNGAQEEGTNVCTKGKTPASIRGSILTDSYGIYLMSSLNTVDVIDGK